MEIFFILLADKKFYALSNEVLFVGGKDLFIGKKRILWKIFSVILLKSCENDQIFKFPDLKIIF